FDLYYQPSIIKLTTPEKGVIAAPEDFYNGWPTLRAARGEWESFQIVITAQKVLLKNVHIKPQSFENPLGAPILKDSWMIFRENYVQIPHPSARASKPNLWWPDALIPQKLNPQHTIEPGKSEVFWLTVRVPQNTEAGHYLGRVEVWANGEKQTVSAQLQVEPFAIPAPTMRANVAVYYDVLRDWYTKNIGPMSDAHFIKLKKEYYKFLLQYRINAYDLPVPWDSPQAADYINNPKVLSIRLPPLSQKKELETAISMLKKNHAMAKGYYYYIDEPSPDRYPEIIDTEKQLHQIDPAIKQCVTIAPNKTLDGSVDIWSPNIGNYLGAGPLDFGALAAQREKGRETWWYTMVIPKYPYPTWLVDDNSLSVRRYGGLMAKYGISGFVYSMAHGWGPHPLNNIASFAGTYGDGTLIYPSELVGGHGPMPSIRLMLLHDAMEDYELMNKYPQWKGIKVVDGHQDPFASFYLLQLNPSIDDVPKFFADMRDSYYSQIEKVFGDD
ncbi:MAG: glycoside hydrolase domain-containing protein, partial [Abditibacteriaceae bacterium]